MDIWLVAVILGLVEGITEFIPVSSTGHLLIAEHLCGVKPGDFMAGEVFNSFIQAMAMLVALPLFRERLATVRRIREAKYRDYFLKLGLAFGITVVGGLVMKKLGWKLEMEPMRVVVALVVGGVLFILVERWLKGRMQGEEVTWPLAVIFGVAQLVAMAFPGASRSGSTILLALAMGLGRPAATEFSFLLGVPTLCAAATLTLWKAFSAGEVILWGPMWVASAVAAVASVLAVRWLLGFVQTHTFTGFGWYRIVAGLVLAVVLAGG